LSRQGLSDNSPAIYRWVSGCYGALVRAIGFATLRNATEDEILPRPCFDLVPTSFCGWVECSVDVDALTGPSDKSLGYYQKSLSGQNILSPQLPIKLL